MTDGKASIREVYAIVTRLEDKFDRVLESQDKRIDGIDTRVSNMEGKASASGGMWGGITGFVTSVIIAVIAYFEQRP